MEEENKTLSDKEYILALEEQNTLLNQELLNQEKRFKDFIKRVKDMILDECVNPKLCFFCPELVKKIDELAGKELAGDNGE